MTPPPGSSTTQAAVRAASHGDGAVVRTDRTRGGRRAPDLRRCAGAPRRPGTGRCGGADAPRIGRGRCSGTRPGGAAGRARPRAALVGPGRPAAGGTTARRFMGHARPHRSQPGADTSRRQLVRRLGGGRGGVPTAGMGPDHGIRRRQSGRPRHRSDGVADGQRSRPRGARSDGPGRSGDRHARPAGEWPDRRPAGPHR